MSLKKNAFSCLLWFVYIVMTVGALVCVAVNLSTGIGFAAWTGPVGAAVFVLLVGLLVFLIHKATLKLAKTESVRKSLFPVLESLAVVLLFAAGILLRICGIGDATPEQAYFEAAKVVEGQTIPQIVHGATYLYLQLLHLFFLLFGNKITVGIILQILLQLVAYVFFYFGVRRIAGRTAAVVMLAFAMLLPGMRSEVFFLSPELLFLFLFSVGFCLTAGLAGKNNPVYICLAGIFIAVVCYFDVSGSLLLLFAFGIPFFEEKSEEKAQKNNVKERAAGIGLCLAGFCLGFLTVIAIDALASGKNVFGILSAWFQLYRPEGFLLPVTLGTEGIAWEAVLVVCCLPPGIFSFWCRKGEDRLSLWVMAVILLGAAQCFGIVTGEVNGEMLFFFLITVVAGIAIQEMFVLPEKQQEAQSWEELVIQDLEKEELLHQEMPEKPEEELVEEEPAEKKPAAIHFIENPLPLPKKHEKKVMDYSVQLSETEDFDFPVDMNDDFDI